MFLMSDVISLQDVDVSTIRFFLFTDKFDERIVTRKRLQEIIQVGRENASDQNQSATARSIVNFYIDDFAREVEFMGIPLHG